MGGPNPLADLDQGVQIRGGYKSAVTPVKLSLSMAHADTLIFISIGDTKDIFCFVLQSVYSVQELVWFCCLFKFHRVRLVRIIIRSTHVYLSYVLIRFAQTNVKYLPLK